MKTAQEILMEKPCTIVDRQPKYSASAAISAAEEYGKQFQDLIHRQSLAIGLIMKHFPKDILSDQMGEDHDTFLEAIK